MSCSIDYYGDTGYGSFMSSRMVCGKTDYVRPEKAEAKQTEAEKTEPDRYEEDDARYVYNYLYGMTGYAGLILTSMWRSWMR